MVEHYLNGTGVLVGSALGPGFYVGSDAARVLRKGMKGVDVKQLQQALTAAGFDPQGTDGSFGSNTESAVRKFQEAKGLKPVDGIAGPSTMSALSIPSLSAGSPDKEPDSSVAETPTSVSFFTHRYGPLPLYGWVSIAAAFGLGAYALSTR